MVSMTAKRSNRIFANGVPELAILQLVSRQEMYGYQLVKAIDMASGSRLVFAEGHIYPLLHSMEAKGYLSCRRGEVNGKVRLYYRITPKGRRKMQVMTGEWMKMRASIDSLLKPSTA
jgi:PadR family transcriptional regulator PadR